MSPDEQKREYALANQAYGRDKSAYTRIPLYQGESDDIVGIIHAKDVLREMRDNKSRGYDQLLVKAFINVTGVFPVGTLAILDSSEMAVISGRNPDPSKVHQPLALVISDWMGVMLAEPMAVDLSDVDPATGAARRTIIKTVDPETYGIKVSDYIV